MTRQEQIKEKMLEISTSNFTSAIDYGAYSAGFMDGVDWADRTMIEKVCEWLDTNLERYIFEGRDGKPYISVALLDELRHDISQRRYSGLRACNMP